MSLYLFSLSLIMFLFISFIFNINIAFYIDNYEGYHKNDLVLCLYK
ncbi:hypothetical protein yrohd0001_38710 [Yersinia rohdei ATCC 43380]|nr:hypothetical protein yrohd0001_38710 [Yersinia rohdei ATCC 43380]